MVERRDRQIDVLFLCVDKEVPIWSSEESCVDFVS